MAAFGMQVLTNRYKSKNLSDLFPNIHSIDEVSPSALATLLTAMVYSHNMAINDDFFTKNPASFFYEYLYGAPEFVRLTEILRKKLK
jgi:hypothetical protein